MLHAHLRWSNVCTMFIFLSVMFMINMPASHLAPGAVICRRFDHHSALHLVSLLPASQKAQDDFHHSGCTEAAYNLFSRKVMHKLCSLHAQGQCYPPWWSVLVMRAWGGERQRQSVLFVLWVGAAGCYAYGTFKDLTIWI